MKRSCKIVSVILAVLLMTSLFSGCKKENAVGKNDNSTASKTEPIKVTLWGGVPEESGPQLMVDAYNKSQNEIQVEYIRFVNDTAGNTKLDTALLGGTGVDLFANYNQLMLPVRARNGSALDLTELFAKYKYDYEKDVGDIAKGTYIDGKPYAVSTVRSLKVFLLNKNMFDAAGIPLPTDWTLSEYRDIAKKLTKGQGDSKTYGNFVYIKDYDFWLRYVWTKLGGNAMWNPDGTSAFDKPEFKAGLQTMYDMMNTDLSVPMYSETITKNLAPETMFLTGKAAMVDLAVVFRSVIDTAKYPHDFVTAFAPYPKLDKSQSEYLCPGGPTDNISISSKSPNKDAAFKFLMWYQTEGILYMAQFGRIPASSRIDKEKVTDTILGTKANLFDKQSFKDYYLGYKHNKYSYTTETKAAPEMNKILVEETEKAVLKSVTVDDALKNMKKRSDEEIRKAK